MSQVVIIEDCTDEQWLLRQIDQAEECIEDHRIIEADEVDSWKIRRNRLEDQLKRVRGIHWRDW